MAIKDIGYIFEDNVKDFLNYMGFKDVCGGNDFKPGGRQVDAVGGWEDTLFIIECKARSEQEQVSLLQIIDSFRGKSYEIKTGLREMNNYYHQGNTYNFNKYKKYIFIIATNNIIVSKLDQQHANKEGDPSIYLWYEIFFDYYKELKEILGDFAIYQLLGEMRVEPRENDIISVPALKYEVNGITLYHFAIEPKKLLPYVCVARRESGNEDYYQRMLDGNRLTDIRSYLGLEVSSKSISSKKPKLFPNNVILAFFSEHQFFTPDFKDTLHIFFVPSTFILSNLFKGLSFTYAAQ